MAAAEERIGPFQKDDTSERSTRDRGAHSRQSFLIGADQRFRFARATDRASYADDVVLYLPDVSWSKKENFRPRAELPHRASQLVPRRSTHPTQILREYHVGAQIAEKDFVDPVEGVAAIHALRNGKIDRLRRRAVEIERRPAHDRQGS